MSSDYVDRARHWARSVDDYEFSRVGNRDLARRNLSRRWGLTKQQFRRLRYDPPKQIAADVYDALCAAFEDMTNQQIKKCQEDLHEARTGRLRTRDDLIREVEAQIREVQARLKPDA